MAATFHKGADQARQGPRLVRGPSAHSHRTFELTTAELTSTPVQSRELAPGILQSGKYGNRFPLRKHTRSKSSDRLRSDRLVREDRRDSGLIDVDSFDRHKSVSVEPGHTASPHLPRPSGRRTVRVSRRGRSSERHALVAKYSDQGPQAVPQRSTHHVQPTDPASPPSALISSHGRRTVSYQDRPLRLSRASAFGTAAGWPSSPQTQGPSPSRQRSEPEPESPLVITHRSRSYTAPHYRPAPAPRIVRRFAAASTLQQQRVVDREPRTDGETTRFPSPPRQETPLHRRHLSPSPEIAASSAAPRVAHVLRARSLSPETTGQRPDVDADKGSTYPQRQGHGLSPLSKTPAGETAEALERMKKTATHPPRGSLSPEEDEKPTPRGYLRTVAKRADSGVDILEARRQASLEQRLMAEEYKPAYDSDLTYDDVLRFGEPSTPSVRGLVGDVAPSESIYAEMKRRQSSGVESDYIYDDIAPLGGGTDSTEVWPNLSDEDVEYYTGFFFRQARHLRLDREKMLKYLGRLVLPDGAGSTSYTPLLNGEQMAEMLPSLRHSPDGLTVQQFLTCMEQVQLITGWDSGAVLNGFKPRRRRCRRAGQCTIV